MGSREPTYVLDATPIIHFIKIEKLSPKGCGVTFKKENLICVSPAK